MKPFVTSLFTDFTEEKQTFWRGRPSTYLKGLVSLSPSSLGFRRKAGTLFFCAASAAHDVYASFAFTASLTFLPSTVLPASAAIVAFMTLPMSLALVAPVSAIAAATAAAISSSDAEAGR